MANLLLLLLPLLLLIPGVSAVEKHRFENHTIHLVFSNHLDVGFTALDSSVIDTYFHTHYPNAIRLAEKLAASHKHRHHGPFRYLTHSWLLSLFFDCPLNMGFTCPNATEVAAVRQAIADGVITWHAAPFNPQYEMFDAGLLGFALDLTHSLDDAFGLRHKMMISLRDVPGLTRAAIPVLASRGIRALTGGVNGFSAPPGVPKTTPFIWRDEASGQQLLAMWHPGGYAGSVKGVHIDSHRDCITAKGFTHVLCASWRDDNAGPPATLHELLSMIHITQKQWPGARVIASTLDDYLAALVEAVEQQGLQLPVVTGELGDTWIHGVASDPQRMADYRAVLRARAACESSLECDSQSAAYFNFSRILVKVAEHTWGISFNQFFGDFSNFTNAWLHRHLHEGEDRHPGLALSVESWRRQRRYTDWALEALPAGHPILTAVAADRQERQRHHGVSPATLAAAGATQIELLPPSDWSAGSSQDDVDKQKVSGLHAGRNDAAAAQAASRTVSVEEQASTAAAAAAAEQAAASVAALPSCAGVQRSAGDLLFCSKSWLIQVDPITGGLLRLQRRFDRPDGQQHMGNDWAAATAPAPAQAAPAAPAAAAAGATPSSGSRCGPSQRHGLSGWLELFSCRCMAVAAAVWSSINTGRLGGQQEAGRSGLVHKLLTGQQEAASAGQQPVAAEHSRCVGLRKQKQLGPGGPVGSSPAWLLLTYNVYNLQCYDFVWDNYAYLHPVWVGDFGKWNMSASSNLSAVAQPKLQQLFQTYDEQHGLVLHLKLSWPRQLVRLAGAPAASWVVLHSPPDSHALHVTVLWEDKAPTRLPEAMWLRFRPGPGAVDESSWEMSKLDSEIRPSELLLNGSHSLHAISRGVSVKSVGGGERLRISSMDVPLVSLGEPIPFPNPCWGPDMAQGVSFNLFNNIWGTNYAMWIPFTPEDAPYMSFRFSLDVDEMPSSSAAATY